MERRIIGRQRDLAGQYPEIAVCLVNEVRVIGQVLHPHDLTSRISPGWGLRGAAAGPSVTPGAGGRTVPSTAVSVFIAPGIAASLPAMPRVTCRGFAPTVSLSVRDLAEIFAKIVLGFTDVEG